MTTHKKTLLAILILAVLLALASLIGSLVPSQEKATAQSSDIPLTGQAWSSNVGWVNFQDLTGDNKYGVKIGSDGSLKGQAWVNPYDNVGLTNNIGWLDFDADTTGAPGVGESSAKFNNLDVGATATGWARFVSAGSDGWDGWVHMSKSTAPSYGVTIVDGGNGTKCLTGQAWGGDVIGWLNFDDTRANNFYQVCLDDNSIPATELTVDLGPDRNYCAEPNNSVSVTWLAGVTPVEGNYTYTWLGDDISGTPTGSSITKTYTALLSGNITKTVNVKVDDDSVPPKTGTDSANVTIFSADSEICSGSIGTGPGMLTVDPDTRRMIIRYQATGQAATSTINGNILAAEITNDGFSPVTGIKIDSITSQRTGMQNLWDLTGVVATCSLTTDINVPETYLPCNSPILLSSLPAGVGNTAYLRIAIHRPLAVIAENTPYTVTLSGKTSYTTPNQANPENPILHDNEFVYATPTLIFDYLVSDINQR